MINFLLKIWWLIWAAIFSVVFFCIALVVWLLTVPFDKKRVVLQKITCLWASLYTVIAPNWRVKIKGREHIDKREAYVVVSNHQSMLDILVAFRVHFHFKFVSKEEIFRIPFIGWNMVLNRYIALRRGDRNSSAQMMEAAGQHLNEGSSVYIFPEGTRSIDGKLKPFKNGAFILAKKLKRPILPIVIYGTAQALPKNTLEFRGFHTITVQVLKPIQYDFFKNRSESDIARFVRTRVKQQLETLSKQ